MKKPLSYKDNLQILESISARLQSGELVDIDELVPMMDQATQAYNACKERIEFVEKALNERLHNIGSDDTDQT